MAESSLQASHCRGPTRISRYFMASEVSRPASLPAVDWVLRLTLLFVLGASFFAISHSWHASEHFAEDQHLHAHERDNHFVDRQETTTKPSAVGYLVVGFTGAVCLLRSQWNRLNWLHPLILCYFAFLCWAALSMIWSETPDVSLRKVAILGLLTLGAVGLAARLSMNDLLWIAAAFFGIVISMGVVSEIVHSNLRPWVAEYRFAGTQHPNSVGLNAAIMCLAAGLYNLRDRRWSWLQWAVVAFGVAIILLTKSRTALGALLAATMVIALMRTPAQFRILVGSLAVAGVCLLGIAFNFVSLQDVGSMTEAASLGRTEDVSSLTGRLPLWDEVWKRGRHRALMGFGWGGFWSADRIDSISKALKWEIPNAHNAYLDLVLNLGIVGLAVYATWLIAAILVAADRFSSTGLKSDLFLLGLAAFVLVHSLAESLFLAQGFPSLVLVACASNAVLFAPQQASQPRAKMPFSEPAGLYS